MLLSSLCQEQVTSPQVSPGWLNLPVALDKVSAKTLNCIGHNEILFDCNSTFQRRAHSEHISELNHLLSLSKITLPQRCAHSTAQMFSGKKTSAEGGKDDISELILITELISYVCLLLVDSWGNCKCLAVMNVEMGKVSILYPGLTERLIKGVCWECLILAGFSSVKGQTSVASVPDREGAMATAGMLWDDALFFAHMCVCPYQVHYLQLYKGPCMCMWVYANVWSCITQNVL